LIWSVLVIAVESLLYRLIAGLASAPGVIGKQMVEQVIRDDFGNPFTFYLPLFDRAGCRLCVGDGDLVFQPGMTTNCAAQQPVAAERGQRSSHASLDGHSRAR
jgi:hypothetical protein